ncbi:MAG: DUF4153 domain-containing protein [Parvibaculaceae bacterium]|nr:DUF4153 domain-containing protein [Parvibaculaceae bacterium]
MAASLKYRLKMRFDELARYPVSVLLLLVFGVFTNLDIADAITLADDSRSRIYFCLGAGVLAGLAGHLSALGRRRSILFSLASGMLAATGGMALMFFASADASQRFVLAGGLFLFLMVAAYVRRGVGPAAFWQFNFRLFIAGGMALLAVLIMGGGLSALLASFDYLFGVSLPEHAYEHVWATVAGMFGPLFLLTLLPRDLDDNFALGASTGLVEKAVSALINYALVPLLLAYALVLHAYTLKILVGWSMPRGEIGSLVLYFGIIGTATYMVAWPWRDQGTWALRWFLRLWFLLLITPVAMLLVAVWQRIAQYGVTPERYCLCLFTFWLAVIVVYMAVRRRQVDLRIIPASLGLLLVLSSVGPWGASAVSVRSQVSQLTRLLEGQGLLSRGHFVKPLSEEEGVSGPVPARINSILHTLESVNGLDRLKPLFEGAPDNPFTQQYASQDMVGRIQEVLGVSPVASDSGGSDPLRVSFGITPPLTMEIDARSRVIGIFNTALKTPYSVTVQGLTVEVGEAEIRVSGVAGNMSRINIAPVLQSLVTKKPKEPVRLSSDDGRVNAVIGYLQGRAGAHPHIDNMEFWLIVRDAP